MTGSLTLAQRRAKVRHMAQDGASNRAIAAELDISKDTVARDLAAPVETPAQLMAQRATRTETAMSQLSAAAQAAVAANPAHTITDDETARRWWTELRATAAQLLAHADEFATYYPGASESGGAP
ncbi:hypothetical protein ACIBKZ_18035 [Streptomyces sp. NPDC050421]|uniref:hypothetical protein n=1 Tax=Streptomyces sp. NPDC050421 TaxID=3365613 RepID=UPI0037B8DB07